MSNNLAKAFSYLIAAHVQALSIMFFAWYAGEWLNENHPQSWNWFLLTFLIGLLAVAQTFYVVVRHAFKQNAKSVAKQGRAGKGE